MVGVSEDNGRGDNTLSELVTNWDKESHSKKLQNAIEYLNSEFDQYWPQLPIRKKQQGKKQKVFVPDTNVLINFIKSVKVLSGNDVDNDSDNDSARTLSDKLKLKSDYQIKDPNDIIILQLVKEEMDRVKDNIKKTPIARDRARLGLKYLGQLTDMNPQNSSYTTGLDFPNGAKLFELFHRESFIPKNIFLPGKETKPISDMKIIYDIKVLQNYFPNHEFIFVSDDANARSTAKNLGVKAQIFEYERIDPSQLYTGYKDTSIDEIQSKIWSKKNEFNLLSKSEYLHLKSKTIFDLARFGVFDQYHTDIIQNFDERVKIISEADRNLKIDDLYLLAAKKDFLGSKDYDSVGIESKFELDDDDISLWKELVEKYSSIKTNAIEKSKDDNYFIMDPQALKPNQIIEFITQRGYDFKASKRKEIRFISDAIEDKYTYCNSDGHSVTKRQEAQRKGTVTDFDADLADQYVREGLALDIHTRYGVVNQDKTKIVAFKHFKEGMFIDPSKKSDLSLSDIFEIVNDETIDGLDLINHEIAQKINIDDIDLSAAGKNKEVFRQRLYEIIDGYQSCPFNPTPYTAEESYIILDKANREHLSLPEGQLVRLTLEPEFIRKLFAAKKRADKNATQYIVKVESAQVREKIRIIKDHYSDNIEGLQFLPSYIFKGLNKTNLARAFDISSSEKEERLKNAFDCLEEKCHYVYKPMLSYNPLIQFPKYQKSALELLLNDDVKCITLNGLAGTGKTFIALLAGIHQLNQKKYEHVIVYKSLRSAGESVGFLPGNEQAKISPVMQPVEDNIKFMFDGTSHNAEEMIEKFKKKKQLQFGVETYIQGRTLRNSFVIVDESHRYTRDEIKMFLSRIGKGSKVVFLGDPIQSLKNYSFLTETNNGFVHMIDKLQGEEIYGHVSMPIQAIMRGEVAILSQKL